MTEEDKNSSPLDEGTEIIAHTAQTAYATTAAVAAGGTAAGMAAGTALAGPLGTVIGALVSNKTVWKILVSIFLFCFLWMFIIANMIGIIFSYLGFANADSYANEAQSTQLTNIRDRVEEVLQQEDYKKEILKIINKKHKAVLKEIDQDKAEKYAGHELVVVDEYETKLKRNLGYYLAVLMMENEDNSTVFSFLGYANSLGIDMSTNLSSPYDSFFYEAAQTYNVPAALLIAMGKVESDFNPNVVSGAGASGIMQLMPSTAASLGVSNVFDPRENIMGGAKYVSQLIEQFKGYSNGLELAIAGYNAGPGAVMKYGYQIPPYAETQAYVKKVLGYVEIQQHQTSTSSSSAKDAQKSDADTEKLQTSYELLKESVEKHLDSFFDWSVTDERKGEATETIYCMEVNGKRGEIDRTTYEQILAQGGNAWQENRTVVSKKVEYKLRRLTLEIVVNPKEYEKYKEDLVLIHGIELEYKDEILRVSSPVLIPHRKDCYTDYLYKPLHTAFRNWCMQRAEEKLEIPTYTNCTICFVHVYDETLPLARVRDHDNYEEKHVQDIITNFFLRSDSGLYTNTCHVTRMGEEDRTLLYVMDSSKFPAWISDFGKETGIEKNHE